jgi:hypothetical protein
MPISTDPEWLIDKLQIPGTTCYCLPLCSVLIQTDHSRDGIWRLANNTLRNPRRLRAGRLAARRWLCSVSLSKLSYHCYDYRKRHVRYCVCMHGIPPPFEPVGTFSRILVHCFTKVISSYPCHLSGLKLLCSIGFSLGLAMVSINMGGCQWLS